MPKLRHGKIRVTLESVCEAYQGWIVQALLVAVQPHLIVVLFHGSLLCIVCPDKLLQDNTKAIGMGRERLVEPLHHRAHSVDKASLCNTPRAPALKAAKLLGGVELPRIQGMLAVPPREGHLLAGFQVPGGPRDHRVAKADKVGRGLTAVSRQGRQGPDSPIGATSVHKTSFKDPLAGLQMPNHLFRLLRPGSLLPHLCNVRNGARHLVFLLQFTV
mmetsp:Transcript_19353/g.42231  ORF Transcript_19353/g.42231 Transcript_19353/m.42231 type:complete len:216 (-) Transcript_19353:1375-2022(-)